MRICAINLLVTSLSCSFFWPGDDPWLESINMKQQSTF